MAIGPGVVEKNTRFPCLIDSVDLGFDNFSPESGGVIRIKGRRDTICPTSGIVGNIIQQMICAQWTDEMIRSGAVPHYYMGMRQRGGLAYNRNLQRCAEEAGF